MSSQPPSPVVGGAHGGGGPSELSASHSRSFVRPRSASASSGDGDPVSIKERLTDCCRGFFNHSATKAIGAVTLLVGMGFVGYTQSDHIFSAQFGIGIAFGLTVLLIALGILGMKYDKTKDITKVMLKALVLLAVIAVVAGAVDLAHGGNVTTKTLPDFFKDMNKDCMYGAITTGALSLIAGIYMGYKLKKYMANMPVYGGPDHSSLLADALGRGPPPPQVPAATA